jgi:hypothetical protein
MKVCLLVTYYQIIYMYTEKYQDNFLPHPFQIIFHNRRMYFYVRLHTYPQQVESIGKLVYRLKINSKGF